MEEIDVVRGTAIGRTAWDAPDVDGRVHVAGGGGLQPGAIVPVAVTGVREYDLEASLPPA